MDKRHIIEDVEFDISFDSVAAARDHEPGLADFIRERLLPLADEIFCELAEDGMVVSIDRLEVDLGDIRHGEFCDEMESRFRGKLRAVLREKMRALATSDARAGSRIGRREAERGQLETFLETGRMAWHADLAEGEAADELLRQTIEHQADAFVEFLRTTSQRDIVVKRLARQFPDRLLVGVTQLLAPAHAAVLGELTGKLGGIAEREFKARLWERLLGECLKTSAPDPARLLGEVAKDLSARDAQSSSEKDAARSSDDIMRERHGAAGRPGETPLAARSRDEEAEDVPRLRAYLETALGTGDAGALTGRWADLSAEHRELVREVFMRRMGDLRLQKKVAEGFPEPMLLDLLDILSPRDGGLMAALSSLPELRGPDGEKSDAFWTCTLAHLHGSQGGDLAAYARDLIRHMTMLGMERRPLLLAIAAISPELNEALADLPEKFATSQSAGENVGADELSRRLAQRLGGASGPDLVKTLAELEREHPEPLAQLLRRLQTGELRAEVGTLDAHEARELALALIRLNPGAKDGGLLRVVETQARQSRDRRRYYRYVLERLIRNEAVDLEVALDDAAPGNDATPQADRPVTTGDTAGDKETTQVRNIAHASDEVAPRTAYLRTLLDAALIEGNAAELVGAWDEIRTAHAGLVRERFERLMGDEGAQARVAQGWPTKQLVELARILAPAESGFVETVAAQLQTGKNGGTGIAQLWQRTLGYLQRARVFDRRAYAENLLRDLDERDADRDDILRAVAHADAALGEALFAMEALRAGERDEPGIAGEPGISEEPGRADELYRRLAQRLGGAGSGADIVAAIEELASAYPETLARLLRQLQSGELRAEVGALDAHEARHLVLALVRLNSGAKDSDFVRAIERYAGRAKSGEGYYRHILDSLLRNRTIDLEAAVRAPDATEARDRQTVPGGSEMAAGERAVAARSGARQGDHEAVAAVPTFGTEPELESAGLQRLRLEEALALGRAEGVAAIWDELLQNRAETLREVFILRLGDLRARARLANGFPESMLLDLVRALVPSEGGFFGMLAEQPELRTDETAGRKNILFWEHTLSYLHACGLRGYERTEYARGLILSLAERGGLHAAVLQAAIMQAVVRVDPSLGAVMSGAGGATGPDETSAGAADFSPEATRTGELLRQLLHRLHGRDRTLAQEIGELADAWPEVVSEFYRQLQSDDALDAMTLTVQEAAHHVAAFIAASHGRMGDEFLRDIESHAGKARNERHYYRKVLEMLIRNRVVDIEEAMAALPDEDAEVGAASGRGGMGKISAPGSLRIRCESALVQGNAEALAGMWNDLRFNRGNLLREVCRRRMGDGAVRKRLAEGFPETMLFDLIRVLAPLASNFIENVEKQLGLQVGAEAAAIRRTVREHALAYLHTHGARGFRRADYARDLMHRLALEDVENGVFLQAMAAIYPALALSLAGQSADQGNATADNAAAHAARIRASLELAFASGDAGGLAAHGEALRGEHRELVREVFMWRMGDVKLQKKVAEGFPESMLLDLMNILSPRDGGFMAALSGLQALRGEGGAKNAAFWTYTLNYLHGSPSRDLAAYARGLIGSLSAQGMEQVPLLRALVAIAPELQAPLADMQAQPATGTRPQAEEPARAVESARAEEFYRRATQRLNGTSREPEFAALLEEMASAYPETLARLQRQMQSGELRAQIGVLNAGEARQMAIVLIWLNAGVKENELLRAIETQARQAQDRQRYYRHILERLIRNETVELEAALDAAALGNDAMPQPTAPAGYTTRDDESAQVQNVTQTSDDVATLARIARLRAQLDTALFEGNAGELVGVWDEIRQRHAGLVRESFQRRMGDEGARQRVAQGFPETLLAELVRILAPAESGFVETLAAQLQQAQGGASSATNIPLWKYTMSYLHAVASSEFDRRDYVNGLMNRLDEQGESRAGILRAVARTDVALGQALSAAEAARAGGRDEPGIAGEPGVAEKEVRAEELHRRLAQRLGGESGGQDIAAMLEELESIAPDNLATLLRRLQAGELHADIGRLDAGDVRQLVTALIRLNSGAKDGGFLRVVEAQARQARDRQRYYRYVLERLIRNEAVDLEVALDDAAPGNDATPQADRPATAGDTAGDKETTQVRNIAHAADEVAARTAYLRTLLDAALIEGNAAELVGAWDEIRTAHAGLVRERFERLMGDEGAQARVAQGWPTKQLVELARILAPAESGFVETVAAQLQTGKNGGTGIARLWQRTLGYLHPARAFDRRAYAENLLSDLDERDADRDDILRAVAHADAALGDALSAAEASRAGRRDELGIAGEPGIAEEPGRADELHRRLAQRLGGASGGADIVAAIEELASVYPETLARLLRQLQAGELHADIGTFDAREARVMTTALIRLNSGAKESEFLRAVERYAARAQNGQAYYRFILENLILDRAIDLEEAASVVAQETARPADDRREENKVLPGAESDDEHRPQVAEDVRPRAITGDEPMQVENMSAFDEHWSKDASDSESAEEIYIANAGMVLATPYLPRLFGMLNLTEGSKFKDERSAERAIHLLQFMVNESCDSPEFLLSLNKLLCGVPTGIPIVREIELLQREKEAIEGMLNGIIQNWTILGNTSVQGLRESFLQRGGRLQLKEDNWHLKVESKGIDVLLDRLPWSFALIKHPWMRRPIYVEWR